MLSGARAGLKVKARGLLHMGAIAEVLQQAHVSFEAAQDAAPYFICTDLSGTTKVCVVTLWHLIPICKECRAYPRPHRHAYFGI